MTKSNEIAILTDAVKKLGLDSYCGDWLKSILPEVESLMRSDFIPTLTIAETRSQCDAMRKEAAEHSAKLISQAELNAAKIISEAQKKTTMIREILRRDIQKALDIV
jgi:cell division septum initiation protein DivIVA